MIRKPAQFVALAVAFMATASSVSAHQLNVFASTDCKAVLVEAKFSNGRVPVVGEVRVLDGDNKQLLLQALGEDGRLSVPLEELDVSTGLLIEVSTGHHDDYWILTPEDIATKCQS